MKKVLIIGASGTIPRTNSFDLGHIYLARYFRIEI